MLPATYQHTRDIYEAHLTCTSSVPPLPPQDPAEADSEVGFEHGLLPGGKRGEYPSGRIELLPAPCQQTRYIYEAHFACTLETPGT